MEDPPTTSSSPRNSEAGNRNEQETSTVTPRLNFPPPNLLYFRSCTKPLAELSRTTVAQMRVNVSAIGFYLLLRNLAPVVTVPVISSFGENALLLVEDHVKKRFSCCLYGHVHLRSETELKELFPVDAVFALKEPFLIDCSDQQYAVVVGGPSDLVLVGRSHVLYKDAQDLGWREKTECEGIQLIRKWMPIGNELLQKRKFYDASEAYLFALNNCSDTSTQLQLNKNLALAYFGQECYESALKHALKVLNVQPLCELALYCAGRVHYIMREYARAKFYFETLNSVNPSNKDYLLQLVRCQERLREAQGNVDIFKLYLASLTDVTAPIDHGNFCRNIEFRPGPGNVRGVFATQDMVPGTLILVEKSSVTVFEPSCCSERALVNFMRKAFRAVMKNPKTLGQKFSYLPAGCNTTVKNQRIFCNEVEEMEPFVNVHWFRQIVHRNMLKLKNSILKNAPLTYLLCRAASWFRHSCLSNCSFLAYKDVVLVRTCASVLKGEELFLRYYENRLSFREKQKAFERNGITCSCHLCTQDKKELTEVHDLRQELKTTFDAQMALVSGVNLSTEERLLPIVTKLELSYKNGDSLRVLLFIVYRDLAMAVDRSTDDWKEKLTFFVERGLQSVGLSTALLLSCAEQDNPQISHFLLMPAVLFDFAGLMAEKENSSGRVDLVKKWVKVILLLERYYRGGNIEMLKQGFLDFKEVPSLLSSFA